MSSAKFTANRLSQVAELHPLREAARRRHRSGGGFAIVALWLIAAFSMIGFTAIFTTTGKHCDDRVAGVNVMPMCSRSTALLLSSGMAATFAFLAIFSIRKPLYCACLGLGVFVSINATGTYIVFQDAKQSLAIGDQNYEEICLNYGIGWSFRLIPIAMLCVGICDSLPRRRRDED